jgi:hypothetical protein
MCARLTRRSDSSAKGRAFARHCRTSSSACQEGGIGRACCFRRVNPHGVKILTAHFQSSGGKAARLIASTLLRQLSIWFQLANVWLTMFHPTNTGLFRRFLCRSHSGDSSGQTPCKHPDGFGAVFNMPNHHPRISSDESIRPPESDRRSVRDADRDAGRGSRPAVEDRAGEKRAQAAQGSELK